MKTQLLVIMAITAASLVSAMFDVYFLRHDFHHGVVQGFQVLDPSQNSCPDPKNTRLFDDIRDVSGDKVGIRCEGSGCRQYRDDGSVYDPSNIDVMEMHLSNTPDLHWTIYKNGNGKQWEMFDVHGVSRGQCEPVSSDDDWFAHCGQWSGYRKMRCYSEFSADFINSHDRGW